MEKIVAGVFLAVLVVIAISWIVALIWHPRDSKPRNDSRDHRKYGEYSDHHSSVVSPSTFSSDVGGGGRGGGGSCDGGGSGGGGSCDGGGSGGAC